MKRKIEEGTYEDIKKAEEEVEKDELAYRERTGRKYIVMLAGFLILGGCGLYMMPILH